MGSFSAVLYLHVIATLGLVAGMGAEGLALAQLRRPTEPRQSTPLDGAMPLIRLVSSICLLLLFLSSGYLADRAGLWRMAWPKVAVGIMIAFGALSGLSSRKLKRIRRVPADAEFPDREIARELPAPFLTLSLGIRTGLVLAAVWLMTAKPAFVASLGIVLAFASISWGVAVLIMPQPRNGSPFAADPKLQRSSR